MPELPEVQTIVNDLNRKIKGYRVVDFWTDWKKSIKMPLTKFKKEVVGCRIKKVKRKGKNILIFLDSCKDTLRHISTEKIILVHLKMTGHLLVKNKKLKSKNKENKFFNEKVNQYIRHIWFLEKREEKINLEFSDLRKFAKIKLLDEKGFKKDYELNKLGIDPTSKTFTEEKLKEILKKKNKTFVKTVLMDQSLIAGIGNIYVSEILFEAGILPKRLAGKIKNQEVKKLHKCIAKVLQRAIMMRGTSDSDYRDTKGAPGGFQKFLKVYNREGVPCRKCNSKIKREKINQRSAYYCDDCQK